MYKIIGGDQKEYGPVDAEQLRRWIQEGRANADTKVQFAGQAEWRPVSAFPEFAAAFGAQADAANQPPKTTPVSAQAVVDPVLAHTTTLDVGACFGRSWALLQKHFWLIVGACAIIFVIHVALGCLPYVGLPAGIVLSGILLGGLYTLLLKLIRGQPAVLGDVFAGFQVATSQLLLTGTIAFLLTFAGLACCILPGIYLYVSWLFAIPLAIDKKLEFWPAMETSRQVVGRQWWVMFALGLLAGILILIGACPCLLIITTPLAFGALAYAYEDVFNPRSVPATDASAPLAASRADAPTT
jgi:uncharacterized membrane protein